MVKLPNWLRIGKRKPTDPARRWEAMINFAELPQHVAIIMDGNGRWAHARGLPRTAGHRVGVQTLKETVNLCGEIGIPILTVYAFSTENWKRPAEEVEFLMQLLVEYIGRELDELHRQGVRVRILGETAELPEQVRREVQRAMETTAANTGLLLNVAVNYGGRRELLRAIRELCQQAREGRLRPEEITEDLVSGCLYTQGLPDPDLLIRPSGEMRLSNFLLWQVAYTEFWFNNVLWPDFRREHFYQAIAEYQRRNRRFGGL
ncbi:MAG: isoprenyl transferase [Syntrophomonadaceae bacterium]|nr:isoprenyl transferase [Syntrophomonadaceae bacterium]